MIPITDGCFITSSFLIKLYLYSLVSCVCVPVCWCGCVCLRVFVCQCVCVCVFMVAIRITTFFKANLMDHITNDKNCVYYRSNIFKYLRNKTYKVQIHM